MLAIRKADEETNKARPPAPLDICRGAVATQTRLGRAAIISWILALAALSSPLWAQDQPCPAGKEKVRELSQQYSQDDQELLREMKRRVAVLAAEEEPLQMAASTQHTAPSSSDASGSVVDGVDFSEFLSLGIDNDLNGDANAFTVNLNAFLFAALGKSFDLLEADNLYQKKASQRARRLGASLSVGGKGESFDRDGDGVKDEALEAEELDDIITWEVRWRFSGSRDRLDGQKRDNQTSSFSADSTGTNSNQDSGNFERFLNAMSSRTEGRPLAADERMKEAIGRFFARSREPCAEREEVQKQLARELYAEHKKETEQAAEEVDKSMIWTLVVGGTTRKEQFGPDKEMAAIRGAWGPHTVNLEWSRTDSLTGDEDPEMLKLGWEVAKQIFKGKLGKDGAKLSASASYESFDNVPDAMHSTNAKVNTKLEIPIATGVKLPLSVTWANHADLLTDEDDISGHFGLSFDTSQLWKFLKSGGGSQ